MNEPSPTRPFHALRHRDFRRFWLANGVSWTGSQMQTAALDWHVWVLTHDPRYLGVIGLTRVIPIIVLSILGGVAADRMDRKRIMLVTQSVMTVVATTLALLTWHGDINIWFIYGLAAMNSAATAFDNPARQALVPRLVSRENLAGAVSINLTMFQIAMIAGPALFGFVVAGASWMPAHDVTIAATANPDRLGLVVVYALNGMSFLAVIAALLEMRVSGVPEVHAGTSDPPLVALKQGLRFVFTTPIMVWTMSLDFCATLFSGAMSLLPVYADVVLGVGKIGYGWLRAAPALGASLGAIGTSVRSLPHRQGPWLLWSVAAYGMMTVVWGLSRSYVLTFAALALTGFADLISTVIRQTLRQLVTPDHLRGRMTGVNMIFFMGGPQLGELEAGLVAGCFASVAIGATVSVVSGGIITILAAAFVAARAPIVRGYDAKRVLGAMLPADPPAAAD